MRRFPTILCLLGLAIFSVGAGMMLRFIVPAESLVDPSLLRDAEALRAGVAGRNLFMIYAYTMAFGAGIFGAGLATLVGRTRLR